MAGFGGVAEYGITVRWDKNFLKIIRLLLERRDALRALRRRALRRHARRRRRVRAGLRPRRARRGRGQADGARAAERPRQRRAHRVRLPDGAAAHRRGEDAIRSPTCRCGCRSSSSAAGSRRSTRRPSRSRTTRCRSRNSWPRYEALVAEQRTRGASKRAWTPTERAIAAGVPRARARDSRRARGGRTREARAPRIVELLQSWGGVDDRLSPPADRQPVVHAQSRGGRKGAGGGHPLRRRPDAARDRGRCARPRVRARGVGQHNDGDGVWHEYARATLPARTILIAAGTQPNTVLAREDARALPARRQVLPAARRGRASRSSRCKGLAKPAQPAVLTDMRADGRAISFFGDLHPSFHGNVVKAMASAKQGYPIVSRMLARGRAGIRRDRCRVLRASSIDELRATRRARRAPDADDRRSRRARARGRAPLPARASSTGCRISKRSRRARDGTRLAMEGLGADRRVGRSRARARVDDRARDGRLVGSVRAAASRASRSS